MKKLKLNFASFPEAQTLSRSHMKNVLGGASFSTNYVSTTGDCNHDDMCPEGQVCKWVVQGKWGYCSQPED